MSELKFANTKWDARTWTQEQKIKWQEKAFELGYMLGSYWKPSYLDSSFFFLEGDGNITQERGDLDYFNFCSEKLKTFEDMFPEEVETLEPEVETKQNVFTHPRWVTALCTMQGLGGLGTTSLTEGKDYKVIDINFLEEELYQYILSNDEGDIKTFHVDHFYKVTPEECTYLPSVEPETEECNSFDDLIYYKPNISNLKYWYIFLKDLSQEQINYIGDYFCTDRRWSFGGTENILMYQTGNYDGEYVWTNTLEDCDTKRMQKVSFNDIFKGVN